MTTWSSWRRRRQSWHSRQPSRSAAGIALLVLLFGAPGGLVAQKPTVRAGDARIERETGTARALYRPQFQKPGTDDADVIAREFLLSEKRIGWDGRSETLRLERTSRSRGGTHLTYQQFADGFPVLGATAKVTINARSEPTFVINGYEPELSEVTARAPTVSQSYAEGAAVKAVEGGDATVRPARLAILPGNPHRLVWETAVWPEVGGEWRALIDAESGSVVEVSELTLHRSAGARTKKTGRLIGRMDPAAQSDGPAHLALAHADGQGMVFDPDPLATSGMPYAPPYIDSDDDDIPELNAERISVPLPGLTQLADEKYRLIGPYVEVVNHRAFGAVNYEPPEELDPNGFNYTRGDEQFEAVMVYYHIDKSQRWVQSLGFDNIQNLPIEVNPFGEGDADISNYYLTQNYLAFGGGGVDDAEDAFVIVHEYGHALLNANVPNFTTTFEGRAIHEGWSDYWAASYQRDLYESGKLPDGDWKDYFRWDGNNPPWLGRKHPDFRKYPDDLTRSSPHQDGLVWASALMAVWDRLGRSLTDQLSLQSHYYVSSGANMADLAEAFIQADIDLYDAEHAAAIVAVFAERGFVDANSFKPVIAHEPVPDTEQLGGQVAIDARVTGIVSPITTVSLFFTIDGAASEVAMVNVGGSDFSALIDLPENPVVVEYYIEAADELGQTVTYPDGGQANPLTFQAGPDNEAPTIGHTPISQTSILGWPPTVTATITDNIGVDSAFVEFEVREGESGTLLSDGRFELSADEDVFSAPFPDLSTELVGGEVVSYRIRAIDRALAPNEGTLPELADPPFSFIVSVQGIIAQFDFEGSDGGVTANGAWEHGSPSFGVYYTHSGSKAWATHLDRAYPAFPGEAALELPSVNLVGLAYGWLEFWHWYDIEHDGTARPGTDVDATLWDGGIVEVSQDGGTTWQAVEPLGGYDGSIAIGAGSPREGEPAFGGFSYGWRRELVQIPAGPDVTVRFVFVSDISNEEESIRYAGWLIDDVSISADLPRDEGGPTVVNEPPLVAEFEAGGFIRPSVSLEAVDDVGVASAVVAFNVDGPTGQETGTARLAQSPRDFQSFLGEIPVNAAFAVPGAVLTYTVTISDFDGNTVTIPESGDPYRVDYVFVVREDQIAGITPSSGWDGAGEGWLLNDETHSTGSASLVLTPVDLPSDAAASRLELIHDYRLSPPAQANVQVSTDGGGSWGVLEADGGYPQAGVGFIGEDKDVRTTFDLGSYAGSQVDLRISLTTDQPLPSGDFWYVKSASSVFRAEDDRITIPRTLELHPNFPDPFSSSTTITYTLPDPTVVSLTVFDILGRQVAELINEPMEPGTYKAQWNANGLAGGTYFVRLVTKNGQRIESVTIVR